MDAGEARARLDTRSRPRGRTHTPADAALLLGAPALLYVGPVVASTSWVGIAVAAAGMLAAVAIPARRRGRADEPLVPRSTNLWANAAGVVSLVTAWTLWRAAPVDQTATVLLVALMPLVVFAVAMVVLYRRPVR